jgi:MFS family permease
VYLSTSRNSDAASGTKPGAAARRRTAWRLVSANVLALGAVSLFTDVSSEMVTSVLPVYITVGLHLSVAVFGFLDGTYVGFSALIRLFAGYAADRWQRRKLLAGSGYALSALAKLGVLAAGSSVPALGAALAVDRTGKGIRTAPRDALITLSSEPENLGQSFGVHRAMDTVGAFAGPLVASLVLALVIDGYDAVFVVSFCVAALGVAILVMFVRDRRQPVADRKAVSLGAAFGLLRDRRYAAVTVCAALLGLVTISDAFVFLMLQRLLHLDAKQFTLLPVGTAAVYMLLAIPFGRLADRMSRLTLFLLGHLALAGVYLMLIGPVRGAALVAVTLVLHGTFYAATDGVLMALAGPLLPAALRTSGLALIQTGQAAAKAIASVTIGLLWNSHDLQWTVRIALFALAAVLVIAALALPRVNRAPAGPAGP